MMNFVFGFSEDVVVCSYLMDVMHLFNPMTFSRLLFWRIVLTNANPD